MGEPTQIYGVGQGAGGWQQGGVSKFVSQTCHKTLGQPLPA